MASLRPFIPLLLLLLCSALPAAVSSRKVTLSVYYETLCPFCSNFMVNNLPSLFSDGLISIVDLHLVPYGNAMLDPNGSISCQHGQDECLLNTIEACAISSLPTVLQYFNFIYCIERLVKDGHYSKWEDCLQQTGYHSKTIVDCYNSGYGTQLELQYAAQTDGLQPPHVYVPWVVVNGKPLYEDYENFEHYICKAYDGAPPKACQRLLTISENKLPKTEEPFCSVDRMGKFSSKGVKKQKLELQN